MKTPTLFHLEDFQRNWLKLEALKRGCSSAQVIRDLINAAASRLEGAASGLEGGEERDNAK